MSALKDQLRNDLTASIKARDTLRSSVIRMVLTAISTAEVAGKQARELSDDEVVLVLGSQAKKRHESAEAFAAGNRPELAQKELDEAAILAEYLPPQLSIDEIRAIVAAAIESSGSAGAGLKAMGAVMRLVTPQVSGRADGRVVAGEVKSQLGA